MKPGEAPDWLTALPEDGRIATARGPARVETQRIGALRLPSGRVVACDPALVDVPPLERRVPAGDYPVTVVIAVRERDHDARIAAAWIDISSGAIASWDPAIVEGAGERERRRARAHGCGVDSGTGSFMSA